MSGTCQECANLEKGMCRLGALACLNYDHFQWSQMIQISASDLENKYVSRISYDALQKRAEAAEAKILEAARWIPVTERLPEKDKKVLLYDSWNGQVDSGYLIRIDAHDEAIQEGIYEWEMDGCYFHGDNFGRITHWCKLPKPPQEEK